ncbi:MAG: hypothetical protein ACOCRX_03170 [Candidatus Woesearchaeota archaeon]
MEKKCECRDYIFTNKDIICKKCKKPMKAQQKPITNKGKKHKINVCNHKNK